MNYLMMYWPNGKVKAVFGGTSEGHYDTMVDRTQGAIRIEPEIEKYCKPITRRTYLKWKDRLKNQNIKYFKTKTNK